MLQLICTKSCSTCRKAVALLDSRHIPYRYRDYREEPLSLEELRSLVRLLGVGPKALVRRHDTVYRELGLTGEESDARLIELMAEHPTLLQRPIAILGNRAVVGRPPERVLEVAREE